MFYCLRWILILSSDLHLGGQSCLFFSYLPAIIAEVHQTGFICATFAVCVILSVCLTVRLSFHPSVRPPFFHPFFRPPIRPTVHPPVKTSTCPTIYPPTHLSNHKPNHPPICLCALRLSVCLSLHLPTNSPISGSCEDHHSLPVPAVFPKVSTALSLLLLAFFHLLFALKVPTSITAFFFTISEFSFAPSVCLWFHS